MLHLTLLYSTFINNPQPIAPARPIASARPITPANDTISAASSPGVPIPLAPHSSVPISSVTSKKVSVSTVARRVRQTASVSTKAASAKTNVQQPDNNHNGTQFAGPFPAVLLQGQSGEIPILLKSSSHSVLQPNMRIPIIHNSSQILQDNPAIQKLIGQPRLLMSPQHLNLSTSQMVNQQMAEQVQTSTQSDSVGSSTKTSQDLIFASTELP